MGNTILGGSQEQDPVQAEQVVTPASASPAEGAAQGSASPFDFAKMIGVEGGFSENWREGLPPDIRQEKSLDSIKTIGTLAKSYVNAQKMIGNNKVSIPGESATKEEWDAFYKATGRPDSPDGYKTDSVKLPEGVTLDDTEVKAFQKYAHEHGLSQRAYEAALAYDAERVQRVQQGIQAAEDREYNETLGKLRSEYGDQLETVVAQCDKALSTFGLTEIFRAKGLLNNLSIIKTMAQIGGKISESKLKDSDPVNASNPQNRLNEIRGNPDDPFYKKDHPAHSARVEEVNGLLKAISKAGKK